MTEWLEGSADWIETCLREKHIRLTGPIEEFHARPWSVVHRVPTSEGTLYFKAPAPVVKHEAALTQALTSWYPDRTVSLIAVDIERGWMLMRDSGTRLREVIRDGGRSEPWEEVLPTYAQLQIDLVSRREELLGLGVPDARLAVLPERLRELLTHEEALYSGGTYSLSREDVIRLRESVQEFRAMCEELARYGVPESLDHRDLNDANVFLQSGRPVFIDWSEAGVTHPFFSLRTVLVSVEISLNLDEGAAPVVPLRDAYLMPWREHMPETDLEAAFRLAQRIWMIPSALSWYRLVSSFRGAGRHEYAHTVPALLKEFLEQL